MHVYIYACLRVHLHAHANVCTSVTGVELVAHVHACLGSLHVVYVPARVGNARVRGTCVFLPCHLESWWLTVLCIIIRRHRWLVEHGLCYAHLKDT